MVWQEEDLCICVCVCVCFCVFILVDLLVAGLCRDEEMVENDGMEEWKEKGEGDGWMGRVGE